MQYIEGPPPPLSPPHAPHFSYVSCTTKAASVWIPATVPAPATEDADGAADTPAPAIDVDDNAKAPAASTDTDDDTAADAPAPAPSVGDDVVDTTSAPSADISRGISLTASPTVMLEETASPTGNDEAGPSSGAAGVGSGVAVVASVALSCAVGVLLTPAI